MASIRIQFLGACAALVLVGCNNTPSPLVTEPIRPGAEQSATVMQTLPPPAPNRQYDPGVTVDNEEKGQKVGAIVTTTGGQKTQQEKANEERAALEKEQDRQNADERTTAPAQ
jgi:hypothetical protein